MRLRKPRPCRYQWGTWMDHRCKETEFHVTHKCLCGAAAVDICPPDTCEHKDATYDPRPR